MIFSLDVDDFGEDPDVVTRILGISPTSSGKKGEYRIRQDGQRYGRPRRCALWTILPPALDDQPMSECLRAIAEITRQSASWDQLPAGSQVLVRGTVIWGEKNPDLVVPTECMTEFARIGAELTWWRMRISGDQRTKYHKHNDRKHSTHTSVDGLERDGTI